MRHGGGSLPEPWTGADAHGLYLEGPLGARLYGEGLVRANAGPEPRAPGGRAANPGPSGDRSNTDAPDDLLKDGVEHARGCAPNAGDSDGDGIRDDREPPGDADQDGIPNCRDTDSDDDTIPDGDEDRDRDGRAGKTETNAYDADTDEDGLCDGEETPATTRTSPIDPDSDSDGLSDGLEWLRRTGCTTPHAPPSGWTKLSVPLTQGRTTFQPYQGPDRSVPTLADGTPASNVADFDGDGLIDGLEDWDATGDPTTWLTNPWAQDSDNDGIADSLEIGIYGKMTIHTFLHAHGGDATRARNALQYAPTRTGQTNPRAPDTDGDGIPDGRDLNPNGLKPTLFQIAFRTFSMQDRIDPPNSGFSPWSPEPYFIIDVTTAAGNLKLETKDLAELPVIGPQREVDLANTLTAPILRGAARLGSRLDLMSEATLSDGILDLKLPESFADLQQSIAHPGDLDPSRVTLKIFMGDVDCYPFAGCHREASDWIDLNPDQSGSTAEAKSFTYTFHIGQAGCNSKVNRPRAADGTGDSPGTFADRDDDGYLTLAAIDSIDQAFFQRARDLARAPIEAVKPPLNAQSYRSEQCP